MGAGPDDERTGARSARPVKIAYCDGPRLRRALLAAADFVAAHRAELDRINLFPVADGDTGTNLALTMRSVADAVRPVGDAPAERYRIGVVHAGAPDLAERLAEEARRRWSPVDVLCEPLTAVISVHTGAGAWGLCYQIEDGGPRDRGPDAAGTAGGR